jgi:hypothetical protein
LRQEVSERQSLVWLLLLVLFAVKVEAQNAPLRGIVRDAATARPIQGAVVVLGTAPAAVRSTRSEEDGSFLFANTSPGQHTLAVRALGFESVTLTVTDTVQDLVVELRRARRSTASSATRTRSSRSRAPP